eukprot:TRINITY_DN11361_c0_g1_i1.p1 TRINITY_DN11361_c0_g1~~TRINITY_DN11361_c0_g1_i1.p1  ORF type:complete len:1357 (+),score=337.85 TRINITY_DN11361_c0_g1_i1:163-4233(+)
MMDGQVAPCSSSETSCQEDGGKEQERGGQGSSQQAARQSGPLEEPGGKDDDKQDKSNGEETNSQEEDKEEEKEDGEDGEINPEKFTLEEAQLLFDTQCSGPKQDDVWSAAQIAKKEVDSIRTRKQRTLTSNKYKGLSAMIADASSEGLTIADPQETIRLMPFFEFCSSQFVMAIMSVMKYIEASTGQSLISDGKQIQSLYMVFHGHVQLWIEDTQVGSLRRGSYFGETHLTGLDTHTCCTMIVKENAYMLELMRPDFLKVLDKYPEEKRLFQSLYDGHRLYDICSGGSLVNRCRIFQGLGETTMRQIDRLLLRRLYFPGEQMLEEDSLGTHLCILVRGRVNIIMHKELVHGDAVGINNECLCGYRMRQKINYCSRCGAGHAGSEAITPDEAVGLEADGTIGKQVTLNNVVEHLQFQCQVIQVDGTPTHNTASDASVGDFGIRRSESYIGDPMIHCSACSRMLAESANYCRDCGEVREDLDMQARAERHAFDRSPQAFIVEHARKHMSNLDWITEFGNKKARHKETSSRPTCYGELGLLGIQDQRSATVVAYSICQVRILYRDPFIKALEGNRECLDSNEVELLLKRGNFECKVPNIHRNLLKEKSIFQTAGCIESFLNMLCATLQDKVYMKGQTVIHENNADDRCMYMLNRGHVKVTKQGKEVAMLEDGAIFGEITVLGLSAKRTSTVIAVDLCWMQVLTQKSVVRVLKRYPDESRKVLTVAFQHGGGPGSQVKSEELDDVTGLDPSKKDEEGWKSVSRSAGFEVLKGSAHFGQISEQFLQELSKVAVDRIYMPGDMIIQEGQRGDGMFVMISGTAAVYVSDPDEVGKRGGHGPAEKGLGNAIGDEAAAYAGMFDDSIHHHQGQEPEKKKKEKPKATDLKGRMAKRDTVFEHYDREDDDRPFRSRVGALTAGSISGELAMLGVSQIRSATIEADTICSMWEIPQEQGLRVLKDFPDAQKHFRGVISEHLERTVPARILPLPLFRGFDRKFRTLLGLYCERRVYFPGEVAVKEGHPGDKLFVVNLGMAAMEKKGVTVKTYVSGSCFGSTVMLGVHKVYFGSFVALRTCHVLVITRTSYLQCLEQYPSLREAKRLKASEQQLEEESRVALQRNLSRKLIQRKYAQEEEVLSKDQRLKRVFLFWRKYASKAASKRQLDEQEVQFHEEHIARWVTKRSQAMERMKQKRQNELKPFPSKCLQEEDMKTRQGSESPRARSPKSSFAKLAGLVPAAEQGPAVHKQKLEGILQRWPTPQRSPHYNLRVWGVLSEAVEETPMSDALLNLLEGARPSTTSKLPQPRRLESLRGGALLTARPATSGATGTPSTPRSPFAASTEGAWSSARQKTTPRPRTLPPFSARA